MKKTISTLIGCMLFICSFGQVSTLQGPELNNEESFKMNRMIEGEDGIFYAYRIRTKGKGTGYYIEKFTQETMKPSFSKEVEIPTDKTKVLDVRFVAGKVYVLYRTYDKDKDVMTLYYKTVSTLGAVSPKAIELLQRKTDHYEFIDFDFTTNQSKTKLAIKVAYKANKEDTYKTDFVLFDAKTEKTEWTKTVNKCLKRNNPGLFMAFFFGISKPDETTGFLGFFLEDNNDIYYGYNNKLKKEDRKDSRYEAAIEILKAESKTPISAKLDLKSDYLVYDIMFSVNKQKNIVISGFFKDVIERTGRDLVDVGIFSYKVNATTGVVEGKAFKIFDPKILTALESNQKKARGMSYKIDYLLPSGDDFYLVGEQYTVTVKQSSGGGMGMGGFGGGMIGSSNIYTYEYMDIIVAKINAKGDFEWITNSPLRNGTTLSMPHVFKQYIAVPSTKGIYLFYNEHAKNMDRLAKPDYEPSDLKTANFIHGTNFVYSLITPDGKLKHDVVFKNEEYCFAPIQERNIEFMPPEDAEIFADGKKDEVFIYTEDRGKGRFCKLMLK
jgi:hypothetical protein